MASTALVKDVLWRVSVLAGDTAPQFQRFPEVELVDWLRDAQVAIAKYLPSACSRTDAIKLVPGSKQSIDIVAAANCIPGDGVALTAPLYGIELYSVVRNMGADGLTIGKSCNDVDRSDLDNFDEDWHTKTGTSVQVYMFDERIPTTFYVSPAIPATPAMYAEIAWTALPKVIPAGGAPGAEVYLASGASTQTITIPDKFVDDIVNYMAARAQMKDAKFAEASKSQMFGTLFGNSMIAQAKALTGVNPNIQTLPGNSSP